MKLRFQTADSSPGWRRGGFVSPSYLNIFSFRRIGLPLLGLLALNGFVFADRIEYADGRVMEGHIVRIDEDFVVIQDGTADFKIPRSLVNRIIEGKPADKWLRTAKAKLTAGDIEGAIQDLAEAANQGVEPASLAAVMMRFTEDLAAAIPQLPLPRKEELRRALEVMDGATLPRQGTLILSRIRLHLQFGNLAGAGPLIEELKSDYPEAYEVNQASFADWFEKNVDESLRSGRYDDALDYLVYLRRLDPERAGDKRVLLVLQWARQERDQGHYEKALDIYLNQLMDQSPEIARNRITDVLEQAEYHDREREMLGRTIILHERYGLEHVPALSQRKLVELWNELGFKYMHQGELEEARKAFTRVDEIKPGAASGGFLQLEHAERRVRISDNDPLAYYELGEWCMKNEMWIEARQAFAEASETEALHATAQAQLKFIDNLLHEKELTRLLALYEKGAFMDVLNGVHTFKGQPLSRGFRRQVEQLEDLTQEAIRLTVAERPQQAEVLWQQAERAYYMRDFRTAQSTLRALIERYPDTPAGVRGEELYRRVRPTLSLNQLEAGPYDQPGHRAETSADEDRSPLAEEIRRLRRSQSPPRSGSAAEALGSPKG